MIAEKFLSKLDSETWLTRIGGGLRMAAGIILGAAVLDLIFVLFQFFFPLVIAAPPVPTLNLSGKPEAAVSYQELESALAARNLFHPTAKGGVPKSSLDEELGHLKLIGILTGWEKRAIFRDQTNGRNTLVKEKETVGNLAVREIRSKSVIVAREGQEREIFIEQK